MFSQSAEPALAVDRVAAQARAHFEAVFAAVPGVPARGPRARVSYAARGSEGRFDVSIRRASPEDWSAAREAEASARGSGLADLAARCASVLVVEALPGAPEWLVYECYALLASVSLGPIVIGDPPAILGVRTARERANQLRGAESLTR